VRSPDVNRAIGWKDLNISSPEALAFWRDYAILVSGKVNFIGFAE
jgi:hypothetical protein